MFNFRNDYGEGAHPDVLAAIAAVNFEGHPGYGDDPCCTRAADLIRTLCAAPDADVQFLIGGTQTNSTAIAAFLRPWEGVISPVTGHINGHEAGAVEAAGHKIITVQTGPDGKLRPELLPPVLEAHADPHMVRARLVYLSDTTEVGTIYTKAELTALSDFCRAHGLLLFLDGARLACALTSPENDLTLPDLARLTDAFYLGGTKNGALFGEALVIVNPALQADFFRIKKQRGAVLAKGWLLGVQFETLLREGLYFRLGAHANAMARRLQEGLLARGFSLMLHSPSNQTFLVAPDALVPKLAEFSHFEVWCPWENGQTVIRLVTSFATRPETVDGFLSALSAL